jgi:DeoR family fructose operon transcriptional repressor
MYAEERQERIAQTVTEAGRVVVADLAREFDVTTETIRRDLAQLESRSVLRRVHGGAVAGSASSRVEESVAARRDRNTAAKQSIAQAAMVLVPDSFSGAIAIDAGTTTGFLAEHIARWRPASAHQSLVVITNSIAVASIVSENPDVEVHLLGGRLRGITSAAVGSSTLAQLAHIRPDIAFIGANGVHAEFGLSTPDQEESAVKTALTRGLAARLHSSTPPNSGKKPSSASPTSRISTLSLPIPSRFRISPGRSATQKWRCWSHDRHFYRQPQPR